MIKGVETESCRREGCMSVAGGVAAGHLLTFYLLSTTTTNLARAPAAEAPWNS